MDKNTKDSLEAVIFINDRMATKDDIAKLEGEIDTLRNEMHEGFASIRAEIRDIRGRLDAIEVELRNHSGYAKEIDHLMERVNAIEKHLGMQHKIAA